MKRALTTITGVSFALIVAACSSSPSAPATTDTGTGGDGSNQTGNGGAKSTDSSKTTSGGNKSTTTKTGKGGNTSDSQANEGGASDGGESSGEGGTSASSKSSSGSTKGGSSGKTSSGSSAGGTKTSGSGNGGTGTEGGAATGGTTTTATSDPPITEPVVVTSAQNAYWKTDVTLTEATSGNAEVTVNDTTEKQAWEGWGGSFNEMGWSYLTSDALKEEAIKLLFAADGAHLNWGRIPMGASDYTLIRYTVDDPSGTDPAVNGETGRPAPDLTLSKFSLSRDEKFLIPYIQAAQKVRPDLKFWASPWTAPIWMKTGWKKLGDKGANAVKPSYFDGGNMKNDESFLKAYAELFKKFVEGYKAKSINIEIVSPQNEPGYEQNYPSCLWEKEPYVAFIGKHLGPAMKELGVKVMLGTMSNAGDLVAEKNRNDLDIASAVLADSTAKGFVTVGGVQWGVLAKVNEGATMGSLPIWATEHKCGNYPWEESTYNKTQAPNDQAYAVESWGYMRDAITKGKVTAYNAWNMVLDKNGLGNDTSRDWRQNALLVVDGGKITKTPFYHVFRHFSQYAQPGGKVVGTTGGDAVAFKNPDGSLVAVMYNSGAAKTSIISIGGKKYSFSMPGSGWATVVVPKA